MVLSVRILLDLENLTQQENFLVMRFDELDHGKNVSYEYSTNLRIGSD